MVSSYLRGAAQEREVSFEKLVLVLEFAIEAVSQYRTSHFCGTANVAKNVE